MKYTFEMALAWMKRGYKVARASWYEDEYLQVETGVILYHWIDVRGTKRKGVLEITSEDLLAEDWEVIDNEG